MTAKGQKSIGGPFLVHIPGEKKCSRMRKFPSRGAVSVSSSKRTEGGAYYFPDHVKNTNRNDIPTTTKQQGNSNKKKTLRISNPKQCRSRIKAWDILGRGHAAACRRGPFVSLVGPLAPMRKTMKRSRRRLRRPPPRREENSCAHLVRPGRRNDAEAAALEQRGPRVGPTQPRAGTAYPRRGSIIGRRPFFSL
jgi:hypothetical protein